LQMFLKKLNIRNFFTIMIMSKNTSAISFKGETRDRFPGNVSHPRSYRDHSK
jgi:hypothetical protein